MNPAPLSGAIQFSNILAQKISIVNPLFAYFVLLYKIFVHHRDTFDIYSIICYYFPYMGGVILKRAELRFLSAMGIFGTIGIFVRYIPLSSSAVAFSRAVLGLAFLAAVMFFTKNKPDIIAIKRNLPLLLVSGAAMGFNWILLFESYKHTTVATATVCYYLAPLLLLLVSPLLGERLTVKNILCVCVALIGLVFVSGVTETGLPAFHELQGILFGLGAAVLYACVMFLNKKLSPITAYDKTVLQLGS